MPSLNHVINRDILQLTKKIETLESTISSHEDAVKSMKNDLAVAKIKLGALKEAHTKTSRYTWTYNDQHKYYEVVDTETDDLVEDEIDTKEEAVNVAENWNNQVSLL